MLPLISFHNRRAVQVENSALRAVFTVEGGHLAGLFHKPSGISPLWIPPWPSIEPSSYSLDKHPEYGSDAESKLLSGIMGHNLCLDLFGPPSDEEAAAGLTTHGEASVVPYDFLARPDGLIARCTSPGAQLAFEREVTFASRKLEIRETVENLSAFDRPIAWQQHVTLGPPFLERGSTQFRAPVVAAASIATETPFDWPHLAQPDGTTQDLRVFTSSSSSGGFTTQLLDPAQPRSYAFAFSPAHQLLLGYVWDTADFPWLGRWEENCQRALPPWNNRTQTLGLEFGASPFPETRRRMIDRKSFLGTRAYRWLPARARVTVRYYAAVLAASAIPESLASFENLL